MNILIKAINYNGGAPRSLIEYSKVLINEGHRVYMLANKGKKDLEAQCSENGIGILYSKSFTEIVQKRNYAAILGYLWRVDNIIRSNKIDLILAAGASEIFFCSYAARARGIRIIGIIPGGDLHINRQMKMFAGKWRCEYIICFSEENRNALIENGINEKKIRVISNRISLQSDINWQQHYGRMHNEVILLIASRLAHEKIQSIYHLMQITERLIKDGKNVTLRIAGDGPEKNELQHHADNLNKRLGGTYVQLLGYIENIYEEICKGDIIFGKGRSAIEPLLIHRISSVIGENQTFALCRGDNFNNLRSYNFSGRGISEPNSYEQLATIIQGIQKGEIDLTLYNSAMELAAKEYDAKYLKEKFYGEFLYVLQMGPARKKNFELFHCLLDFYYIKLITRLRKSA